MWILRLNFRNLVYRMYMNANECTCIWYQHVPICNMYIYTHSLCMHLRCFYGFLWTLIKANDVSKRLAVLLLTSSPFDNLWPNHESVGYSWQTHFPEYLSHGLKTCNKLLSDWRDERLMVVAHTFHGTSREVTIPYNPFSWKWFLLVGQKTTTRRKKHMYIYIYVYTYRTFTSKQQYIIEYIDSICSHLTR